MFFAQTSYGQFITTWQTLRDDTTITIPTNSMYTYDYTVDWGDGTTSTNQTGDASHNYALKGTYTVSISGTFPAIYVDYDSDAKSFLKTVEQWGDNPWKSMKGAFEGCAYFRILATDIPDLSNVTDMSYMFSAINLNFDEDDDVWNIPNVENWDMSNVTNMGAMFNFFQGFNQDISGWDVSNVEKMNSMFRILRNFNQDISGWDVSNVTDMSNMFDYAENFNQDISSWDVSKVTDMSKMFEDASAFNQDIGDWEVSNVTDMGYMFSGASAFNQDIGDWKVSNVADMVRMLDNSGLSSDNYDALLTGWATQTLKPDVSFGATGLTYCNAESARTILTSAPNNWFITDDGTNCIAVTLIPDPNFEQALIDENIDTDGVINGQVLQSDISTITFLDVNSENISDLTGIEGFTALETLFAHNNTLTSIDLSGNTNVVSLSLNDNALTEIDVSALNLLEELSIANNNVTELQINKNNQLRILNCSSNQITALNTLSNVNLENLNCEQNSIEYLNLSQNALLTKLACNDNALKGLNIKNGANTNISNQDFAAFANYNLSCIEVDDVDYSSSNWVQIEMGTSFSLNCTPVNDDCSFTIPIILGQDTPGNTSSASASLNNPNCLASGSVPYDVWYSFPAPASGSVTMTINAPPLVGKVALYNSCNDAQPIYCGVNELVVNNLTPNTTYYLQVWLELSGTGKSSGVTKQLNANGAFVFNVADSSTLSISTINNDLDNISLWPNPAYDNLNITSKNTINSVEVFNVSGQKIIEKTQINSANYTLDVSKLNSGFYFVKTSGSVNNSVKKVLIK